MLRPAVGEKPGASGAFLCLAAAILFIRSNPK